MGCMQTIVGQRMARDFDGQVAEPQIRAAILNRFTAPGTPKTRRLGVAIHGKGKPDLSLICATEPEGTRLRANLLWIATD